MTETTYDETTRDKHAVILSGGGAEGAYEVGVLKALIAGKSPTTNFTPLEPDVFTGTSIGAYNAAFLVSQWKTQGSAANANLEQIWLNDVASRLQKTNGAFRIRGLSALNPFSYIPNPLKPISELAADSNAIIGDLLQRGIELVSGQGTLLERGTNLLNFSSFISNSPLRQLIADTINFAEIRKSDKKLVIIATNWVQGIAQPFREYDMSDQLGPEVIMASAAIPGIFPRHNVGAYPYVDGGVLLNTPLQPAIEAGANILHVMTLNPEVEKIPLSGMSNTLETAYRQQVIGWVKAVDRNINQIWAYNRTREVSRLILDVANQAQLGRQAEIDINLTAEIDKALQIGPAEERYIPIKERIYKYNVIECIQDEAKNYIPVTVYLYRPNAALGGYLGLLDFSVERMEALINRGFDDAVNFIETDKTYVAPYPITYRLARQRVNEARLAWRARQFDI